MSAPLTIPPSNRITCPGCGRRSIAWIVSYAAQDAPSTPIVAETRCLPCAHDLAEACVRRGLVSTDPRAIVHRTPRS